jgi:hypothetical protein
MEKPTWRNTFNSDFKSWGSMIEVAHAAEDARYPFFTWKGKVHEINLRSYTGLTIEELE